MKVIQVFTNKTHFILKEEIIFFSLFINIMVSFTLRKCLYWLERFLWLAIWPRSFSFSDLNLNKNISFRFTASGNIFDLESKETHVALNSSHLMYTVLISYKWCPYKSVKYRLSTNNLEIISECTVYNTWSFL